MTRSRAALVVQPVNSEEEQALSRWLTDHGLSCLLPCLLEAQLDLELLDELDDAMLERLGLSLGMRLRLLRAVRRRNAAPIPPRRGAERRQLSVMFCDIVDSTALATQLDAEDLRSVLDAWRQRVIDIVQPAGGYLSQFLGDGALLYFGYPVAGENDAEQAVRAALALLSRSVRGAERPVERAALVDGRHVSALIDTLQLRIGIATGPVVLDRLTTTCGQGELSAVGRVPHLAARLQGAAPVQGLCVDERTARQCGNAFELSARTADCLRGFTEPTPVYTVLGPRLGTSRFEARHADGLGALVGRVRELQRLEAALSRMRTGRARTVLLEGEAGIGKSRLCFEFLSKVRSTGEHTLVLQCSPFHADSPLHAVRQGIQQRIERADDVCGRARDELVALATRLDQDGVADVVGGAAGEAAYRRRQALLTSCLDWFERCTTTAPLTVLLEDLHWCDATTVELLEALVRRCAKRPLLLLLTARPGTDRRGARRLGATRIALTRLAHRQVECLLQRQLRTHRLPVGLCSAIERRTDGVPLFVEELTRSLCESGHLQQHAGAWRFDLARSEQSIPDTLQASLASRIDLLDESLRTMVRMAACLGRTFAFDDLVEVLDSEPAPVLAAIDELIGLQLLRPVSTAPVHRYGFRHALVRDVAWNGVLQVERRQLHARVQRTFLARRACGLSVAPDRLARHLEGAGERDAAISEWRAAAHRSAHHSAHPECRSHLLRALALIEADPARSSRLSDELGVLLELIPPCRMVSGFASAEVVEFTQRALTLADDRSYERTALLKLVYFEWVHEFVSGDRRRCIALAESMLRRATQGGDAPEHRRAQGDAHAHDDDGFRMTALRALGASQIGAGRLRTGMATLERSLSLYRADRQGALIEAIGMDGLVLSLGYRLMAAWCVGERAAAHRSAREMVAHAGRMAHPPSLAFALYQRALLAGVLEQRAAVLLEDGEALRALGHSHRFASWEICGELLHDLGMLLNGPSNAALSRAERTLRDSADMGIVYHPLLHDLLARTCLSRGARGRAIVHLAAAFALRSRTGERWSDARLWLSAAQIHPSRFRTCLRAAIRSAGRSGATTWLDEARRRSM